MKNKSLFLTILSAILIVITFVIIKEIILIISEQESKSRVFNDMQDKSDVVIRGIVGIIPESKINGLTSYNGTGSGVIFEKKDNTYYVVTAKHVVDVENDKLKIFTKDTEFSGKTVKVDDNVNFEIPDDSYYKSLIDAKIEYISNTTDLAILSFEYDGDLTILNFETNKLSKNDRIMVIGHPEGNKYKITYGYIKSVLKDVRNDKVIEHNAYMKQGNSGGVALTENMKIAGINIAGSFSLLGHYRIGYMIPYDIVEDNIKNWRNSNTTSKTTNQVKENDMNTIQIKVNNKKLNVKLEDNSASKELVEKLKNGDITIEAHEYGGFEKVGDLGFSLSKADKNITTEVGDIVLYQGNQISVFYNSNSWSYTKLGKIQNVTSNELKEILGNGDVDITFILNDNI